MMMNLFSIFDPSTSMNNSLNWISSMMIIMFMPSMYWYIPSRWNFFFIFLLQSLMNDCKKLFLKKSDMLNMLLFIGVFFMIFLNNILGMVSYIFTSSSHMVFGLTLSVSMWLSFMLFGWVKNMNHMFSHMVPEGVPLYLVNFMVIVETISNLLRLLSLAIRLCANVVAGHFLMSLLVLCIENPYLSLFSSIFYFFLMVAELFVSFLQAYVFMVLLILYSSETS
nr:ATP synthase F0 subunit 6 [Ceratosolen solmsi]